MKIQRARLCLISISILLSLSGCETPTSSGGSGFVSTGSSDYSSFSPATQRRLRQMDLAGAIDTVVSGPTACGADLVRGASQNIDWETFSARSQRSGNNFSGAFGRVEFYNGSHLSLPGEAGITATGNRRHLDEKILDIIPFLAMAHQRHNQAVRVSHTTTGRHSANSLHYSGRAIDIDPSPASARRAIAREIVNTLASSGKGCGYFVYLESSHIHVSYKGEGRTGCPGYAEQ